MATVTKITRVANPRRKRRNSRVRAMVRNKKGRFVKKSAASRMRKMRTRNGTKRKARRVHNSRITSPRRRTRMRKSKRVARRRSNPVLIELGAINPFRGTQKRRKNVATRKRRKSRNPRRRRHVAAVAPVRRRRRRAVNSRRSYRRRRNPVRAIVHRRRRRRNPVSRRRSYRRTRRNPVFGMAGGKNMLVMVGGGLVGVAATKFLPTLIPSSITSSLGASPLVGIALTVAGAFAASWLAKRISPTFGEAVLFGGLMQAGSVALTAFAPPSLASQLALSGMGDILPGYFTVPQNPIMNRAPMAIAASTGGGGMGAAIPRAFGRR